MHPQVIATPRLRLIACGALARELLAIINQLPPDVVELKCLPAAWHNLEKFARHKRQRSKPPEKLGAPLLSSMVIVALAVGLMCSLMKKFARCPWPALLSSFHGRS